MPNAEKVRHTLKTGDPRRLLPPVVTVLLVGAALGLYRACGASPAGALGAWCAAALGVLLPGLALTARFAPQDPARPALTVLYGSGAFLAAALLAAALRTPRIAALWTAGWLLATALRLGLRPAFRQTASETLRRTAAFFGTWRGACLMLIWAALVFLNALWAVHYAHPAALGAVVPSQDFFWNLGNVQSFALGLPPTDLRVAGVTVTYHWLTELYQAGLWFASGLPAYDVAAFYAYAPVAAGLVCALYALGRQLWAGRRRGTLRALALAGMPLWLCCASLWKTLAAGTSRFGNSAALHTISNINGQATAYLFLALALLLLDRMFRSGLAFRPRGLAALLLAFYLLAFAKSPQAAILAIALALVLALLRLQKRASGRGAALLAAGVCLGFLVLYRCWFAAGASSSMAFSATGTLSLYYFASILRALQARFPAGWQAFVPALWAAQSLLMAPAAFPAWLAAAVGDLRQKLRVAGSRLLWHACAAGGLLAFYLFDHYSSSQIYFANLAVFCMGLLLLDSLPEWLACLQGAAGKVLRGAAAALLAAGGVTLVCLCVWLGGTAKTLLTVPQQSDTRTLLTAGEEQACAWLAEHMDADAYFATNRMHTGTALEGLSNVYTGLAGRRAYMESFKYAVSNMGGRAGDVMARYEQMNELFSPDTSEARLRQLCAECGVEYLLYCPEQPGSEAQLACFERVYQNESCTIYRVQPDTET